MIRRIRNLFTGNQEPIVFDWEGEPDPEEVRRAQEQLAQIGEENAWLQTLVERNRHTGIRYHSKEVKDGSYLDDPTVDLSKKLGQIKQLLMTNKTENLVGIEKFLINLFQENTLTTFEKFRIVDDFLHLGNAMMLSKTIEWIYYTGIELFWILFRMDIGISNKINALYFLLRNELQTHRKEQAIRELVEIAQRDENRLNVEDLASVADLLTTIRPDIAEHLLQILRRREAENERKQGRPTQRDIYHDTQNVHDSDINNSIKSILEILVKDDSDLLRKNPLDVIDDISVELRRRGYTNYQDSLNRISTDFAVFTEKHRLRLRDILHRIWNRIVEMKDEEMKKNAIGRLHEELLDMRGMCSTGHMSRLVNVLSGFPGFGSIRISWNAQIQANITARLNTRLKVVDTEGDLISAMISLEEKERQAYVTFLKENKESLYKELYEEFKDVFDREIEGMEILNERKFLSIFGENYPTR